jgi:hypothetical protein
VAHFSTGRHIATRAEADTILAAARAQAPPAGTAFAAEALTPEATTPTLTPGVERWPVKTGTDATVGQVDQSVIVPSTVRELGSLPRPAGLLPATAPSPAYQSKRAAPVETTVWQVTAMVTALKLESDGDYHLVLQDTSGAEMVAEIPLPQNAFIATTSPFFPWVKAARAAVDAKFGPTLAAVGFVPSGTTAELVPQASVASSAAVEVAAVPKTIVLSSSTSAPQDADVFSTRIEPAQATITGVGFFDYAHGQTGAAPNIIELHPVLDITFA